MESTNEYALDITQRIKDFLPSFIANIQQDTYENLCVGFNTMSTNINEHTYKDIITLINCYINIINDVHQTSSSNENYLMPLINYCNNNDDPYCEKSNGELLLQSTLINLIKNSEKNNNTLPTFIKKIISDLRSIDPTIPRYKIIISFINMVIDGINEYNSSSSQKIIKITRISDDKINLYDDNNESVVCPQILDTPSVICDVCSPGIDKKDKPYHYIMITVIIILIIIIAAILMRNSKKD